MTIETDRGLDPRNVRFRNDEQDRRARVWPVHGTDLLRISIHRPSLEQVYGPGGWPGGRVLWGCDQTCQDEAERIALAWVTNAEIPSEARPG